MASTVPEWNPEADAKSESDWQVAVGSAICRRSIFQAASYYQPPSRGWSAQNFFHYANASAYPYIKVFSHHNYPQSALAANEPPPNVEYLMSHINITINVGQYKNDVVAANVKGFDYVFGETNSGKFRSDFIKSLYRSLAEQIDQSPAMASQGKVRPLVLDYGCWTMLYNQRA